MKWTRKIAAGFVGIALLVFILPGLFTPKITFTTDTTVRKPLSSVYITMGDPSRLARWMNGFEKIEHVRGMPFCEGSTYRMTLNLKGRNVKVMEEIIRITWKKRLTMKMSLENMDMTADLIFFQIDESTVIKGTYDLRGRTWWMRLLLPWMKPVIRRDIERQLDDFREMMEKKSA